MPKQAKTKQSANVETLTCIRCGKVKAELGTRRLSEKFFKCTHFKGTNMIYEKFKVYNWCKDCMKKEIYDSYGNLNKDKFKELLKNVLNRPYVDKVYNEVLMSGKEFLGEYMKRIAMNGFNDLTWEDSEFEELSINERTNIIPNNTMSKNKNMDLDYMQEKWGYGYSTEEYLSFEKKWNTLIDNYGEKTSFHTENLKTYIRFRVKEEMATAKGEVKDAKEWGAMADKAGDNAKINVKQLSKSDLSGGVDLVCQIFEAVESETGIIPLLPRLTEQPYDDADIIIWSIINYGRRLEGKQRVEYKEIWDFYDEMLQEYFTQQGFTKEQGEEFKRKRNNVFRDLGSIYKEPIYEEGDS